MNKNHKCTVRKAISEFVPWYVICTKHPEMHGGYFYMTCDTWEEAMLEALHHRMRNNTE